MFRVLSLFFFGVFLFVAPAVLAQTGDLKGFLYDKEKGEAVIYTNVYLKGTKFGVATDVNGFFAITNIPAGRYTMMVTSVGFENLEEEVDIIAGKSLTKKVFLKERTVELEDAEILGSKLQNILSMFLFRVLPQRR
jgi:hypothetical protein